MAVLLVAAGPENVFTSNSKRSHLGEMTSSLQGVCRVRKSLLHVPVDDVTGPKYSTSYSKQNAGECGNSFCKQYVCTPSAGKLIHAYGK
jgi:hypothetical protein